MMSNYSALSKVHFLMTEYFLKVKQAELTADKYFSPSKQQLFKWNVNKFITEDDFYSQIWHVFVHIYIYITDKAEVNIKSHLINLFLLEILNLI